VLLTRRLVADRVRHTSSGEPARLLVLILAVIRETGRREMQRTVNTGREPT